MLDQVGGYINDVLSVSLHWWALNVMHKNPTNEMQKSLTIPGLTSQNQPPAHNVIQSVSTLVLPAIQSYSTSTAIHGRAHTTPPL